MYHKVRADYLRARDQLKAQAESVGAKFSEHNWPGSIDPLSSMRDPYAAADIHISPSYADAEAVGARMLAIAIEARSHLVMYAHDDHVAFVVDTSGPIEPKVQL